MANLLRQYLSMAGPWTHEGQMAHNPMSDYVADYRDMMEPAYILFDGKGGGEFAFGGVSGAIYGAGDAKAKAVDFSSDGNDEMDSACGDGWAKLRPDGSLKGRICFQGGDEADFTARHGILLQQPAKAGSKTEE